MNLICPCWDLELQLADFIFKVINQSKPLHGRWDALCILLKCLWFNSFATIVELGIFCGWRRSGSNCTKRAVWSCIYTTHHEILIFDQSRLQTFGNWNPVLHFENHRIHLFGSQRVKQYFQILYVGTVLIPFPTFPYQHIICFLAFLQI